MVDVNKMGEWLKLFFADPIEGWYSPQYNQEYLEYVRSHPSNTNHDINWVNQLVSQDDPNKVVRLDRTPYNDWQKVKIYKNDVSYYNPKYREFAVAPRNIHPNDERLKSMAKMFADKFLISPAVGVLKKSPPLLIPYLLNKTAQPAY